MINFSMELWKNAWAKNNQVISGERDTEKGIAATSPRPNHPIIGINPARI